MQKQYETMSSRDLRQNPAVAMGKADVEPIIILSGSTQRSILVSFEPWNQTATELNKLMQRIEELEDSVEVWRGLYEVETGKEEIIPANITELEKAAGRVPA